MHSAGDIRRLRVHQINQGLTMEIPDQDRDKLTYHVLRAHRNGTAEVLGLEFDTREEAEAVAVQLDFPYMIATVKGSELRTPEFWAQM